MAAVPSTKNMVHTWTGEDKQQLLELFDKTQDPYTLACAMERTPTAIIGQLVHMRLLVQLGFDYYWVTPLIGAVALKTLNDTYKKTADDTQA